MEFNNSIYTLHLLGILIGAGGAFYMGLVLTKLCDTGKITRQIYLKLRYANKVCIFAATVLWSTMAINISYLGNTSPEGLLAAELWASLTVIGFLTANLYLIRRVALPIAKARLGISIFGGLSNLQISGMLTMGAVSTISWITVFLMWMRTSVGTLDGSIITYSSIVLVYLAGIAVAVALSRVGAVWVSNRFFRNLERKQSYYNRLVTVGRNRRVVHA